MAGLQLLVGTGVILVAVLHPEVRDHQASFGTLIALGTGLIGNIAPSPIEWKRRSVPPPPPLGR